MHNRRIVHLLWTYMCVQDSAYSKRTQKLCVPADDFAAGVSVKNDKGVVAYAYVVVFKRS